MKVQLEFKNIFMASLLLFGIYSCRKSELPIYENDPGIFIYKDRYDPNADSTSYSFAIKNSAIVRDTIWVPVRIMGQAASHDRTIKFDPVDSLTTAVEGTHYELMTPYVMPADSFATRLGVIIKRAADLQDTTVHLTLHLEPSPDFKRLLNGQSLYYIKVNDILTKPDNWGGFIQYIFGEYSQVKYRFIIDVLGRAEFPTGPGGLGIAELFSYQAEMKNALNAYNKAHPNNPMRDENHNLVTF